MELTTLAARYSVCPVPRSPTRALTRRRLLGRLHTPVETSLFFPVLEEAATTVMLKDKPGPPTPPSLTSTYKLSEALTSRALPEQLLVGWRLERCWVPLPALPPLTRYKARLRAAVPAASTRPRGRWCCSRLSHPPAIPVKTR